MVSETSDVQSFLSRQALFGHLSEAALESVCDSSYTAFNKSGNVLTFANGIPDTIPGMLIVRSGSLEIRTAKKELIDRLSEGDFLIPQCLIELGDENFCVTVLEDCLYYELSSNAYQGLYNVDRYFAYLCDSFSLQFKRDDVQTETRIQPFRDTERESFLDQRVQDFMTSPAISALPSISIREAATIMKERNISSLLITDNSRLVGIVTDRDLRTRVLAEGIADSIEIATVMTESPVSIEKNAVLHQAQLTMMSANIHHLPVIENQSPIGLIGLSDIVRANNIEPVSLTGSIKHANSVTALRDISKQFPNLVAALIERDTRAVDVGEIITSLTDGITKRLIEIAQQQLGEAPCPFAWLAFGSQARQEQVLGSDQDNALIIADKGLPTQSEYFKQLAEIVNDGLHQCGVVLCPGDIMARNPKWRLTLSEWRRCFSVWIEQPSPKALMHASIFFDMRHIAGDASLTQQLRQTVLDKAQKNTIFLALMSENSLSHSPPLGFFKTFVLEKDGDHNRTLDLKKRGTIPIVDIARNYSLSAGVWPVTTFERLKAIEAGGVMSKALASSLIDAHEFIAGIRLESQGAQFRAGQDVDNHLDPKTLSPLMRHQLKEAFHLVRQAQAAMKARFGGGIL
ncbi:DUF294 nucleotidyltransferase-like domain-containing protein [Teredinibacter purpureus]|uniref:DUF294 nucleotidyltransferase-like domain-containing protein n=1 Tax=Teredinibacter purpureus TaxID=2731756 RepID=UPI0005F81072|nr:DUF294 nucleotidyltransferase-like domain-containing protein [Teredinibacter purpureus]